MAVSWVLATGGPALARTLTGASPVWLVSMLALTSVWLAARFIRWQFLLRRADVRVPVRGSVSSYLAGLAGTATPGYVGEVIRPVLLRRAFGAPLGVTIPVLVLERVLDVVALAAILAVFADRGLARAAALAVLAVAAALWLLARAFGQEGARAGRSEALGRPDVLGTALALSLVAWVAAGLLLLFAAGALGYGLSPWTSLALFSQATLGGAVTLMPAGVGATGSVAIIGLQDVGFTLTAAVSTVSLMRLGSAGVGLSLGAAALLRELRVDRGADLDAAKHFDEISEAYGAQFSEHIWSHLLQRKMGMVSDAVGPPDGTIGLDLGCGLGEQSLHRRAAGYAVLGVDPAFGLLRHARASGVPVAAADGARLPFRDGAFDYVYAVGVLHHVPGWDVQSAVCDEVRRVLRTGGRFLVHETNPRNPLFRFYMGYVFPLLKRIDEGIEWWIPTERLTGLPGFRLVETRYFTFIPDFLPSFLLRPFHALERRLEASRLRRWSVHYMAVLEAVPVDSARGEPRDEPAGTPRAQASGAPSR